MNTIINNSNINYECINYKYYVKLYLLLYNMITSYKYIKPLDIDNKKDKNYVYI